MKKLLFLSIITIFIAACSQTPEQKAEELIKDSLKKSLYKPDTYKPVDTKVDSAFTPYDDPKVIEEVNNFFELTSEAMSLEEEMKLSKSTMALWSDTYMSEYSKNKYNDAKEKFESDKKTFDEKMDKVNKAILNLSDIINKKREFVGYKVTHNYRAENNAENTLIGNTVFIIDKEFKEVLLTMELEEYEKTKYSIDKVKELIEEANKSEE